MCNYILVLRIKKAPELSETLILAIIIISVFKALFKGQKVVKRWYEGGMKVAFRCTNNLHPRIRYPVSST